MSEQSDVQTLQAFLRRKIPLSSALGVDVISAAPGQVILQAPLEPNHNHQGTAFGGSLYSVAVLAAWSLAQCWLKAEGQSANVVIQNGGLDYLAPVDGAFEARAVAEPEPFERLKRQLQKRGKGRVEMASDILCGGRVCARFSGRFVFSASGEIAAAAD